jgi:MFS family permease
MRNPNVRGTARSTPAVARYTWRLHFPSAALAGAVFGIVDLASFVAKRSLAAPAWVVPAIMVASQVPWVLAPAWEVVFARVSPRRVFLWLGALTYLPLLLVAFVVPVAGVYDGSPPTDIGLDLVLFFLVITNFHFMHGAYLPHRGGLLRANYPEWVRGRMYARAEIVSALAVLVAARVGGALLDLDASWMRVLFPLAGLMGLLSAILLGRIRWRRDGDARPMREPGVRSGLRAIGRSWRDALRILRTDRPFYVFEVGFMLYGVGLLAGAPLVILLAEGPLGLSYNEWTDAKGVAMPIGFIGGLLFAGRLVDRLGVARVGAGSFGLLAVYFAAVTFAQSAGHLTAALFLFGVAMAGVTTVWALGPLHYAPPGMARTYAGVHVSLVGARSALAPALGYAVAELVSLRFALGAAAVLIALGAFVMLRLAARTSRSDAPAA